MASATYGPSACGLRPRTLLALPKRYTILFPVPVTSAHSAPLWNQLILF
jgi:hypothetical protein